MSPKDKVNATSSESTSSSNSSSSSSSSSSTSGSESSSSDSENSSTSQASAAKSNGSTDSDNRKPAKKKATPVKGKNAASNECDSSKSKDKTQNKGRNSKSAANYSSEDDIPVKPPPKRKPPAKPKATATVTPITKPRQPTARAKATAAARATANKDRNVKGGAASKQAETAAQKKLKTKSIFSPENSSESDDQDKQPPKLSPMKSTAKIVSHSKPKPKATSKVEPVPAPVPVQASKSNSSATSTSGSSGSSDSSSDSETSADSSATAKPAKKKACTIKKISASTATTARQRGEQQARSKAQASAADTGAVSESEGERKPVTRKLTRSSSARRSKHLIGKTSDTESETEIKVKVAPAKKSVGPKGPAQRPKTKTRSSGALDSLQKPIEEERKCPLEGCDSLGHLSGKLDKHFTIDACPMYHNKSAQECKDVANERKKHEEERRKAIVSVNKKSPKGHLTVDQRHFQLKIKEMRTKHKPQPLEPEETGATDGKEREPKLANLVPDYDLKLFQEAQAVASEKIEDDLKTLPHVKGTKYVEMGKFEMEVWYQSPYPEEYTRVPKLYICEYCLRYMKSRTILKRHMVKCVWRHPPGEEVYRKEKISVWEVDGKRYKQYCQNLCLLAKFFLDHKTLYYDVEPFLFYVMTIGDVEGCHTVGYFSKEKNSFLNYNVSCILTLPPYQRQGYGRLLIDFSYLLTRVERKIGSPEKPLSDLGLISYRSYWKDVLLEYLCKFGGKELSIKDLSQEMAINSYDIVSTLQALGMMKYWKGKHIILKKQDVIEEYEERMKRRGSNYKEIDPAYLKWSPFAAPPAAGPP